MSVYSYAWTTSFATPAALSGLVVTPNTEDIGLDLAVTPSVDTYHEEYLWEAQFGDGEWTEIGRSTDETFTLYLVPLNTPVRIRVSDSNGALYSATTEGSGELDFPLWALTEVNGDADFIAPLRWVQEGATVDIPLDQVVLQPLSGLDGDTQLPIVFTGQWQGERVSLTVIVPDDDQALLQTIKAATLRPSGTIALKSPDGAVYLVQFGAPRFTNQYGFVTAVLTAIRIA